MVLQLRLVLGSCFRLLCSVPCGVWDGNLVSKKLLSCDSPDNIKTSLAASCRTEELLGSAFCPGAKEQLEMWTLLGSENLQHQVTGSEPGSLLLRKQVEA